MTEYVVYASCAFLWMRIKAQILSFKRNLLGFFVTDAGTDGQ